jgi:hypothetical protein
MHTPFIYLHSDLIRCRSVIILWTLHMGRQRRSSSALAGGLVLCNLS